MGKKITNPKLLRKQPGQNESMSSVFNKFANKLNEAKRKKIQKVGDTKQRIMESKKTNKLVKVSKRTSKFALLDDEKIPTGLTHRGKNISELKEFNDMNFDSDVEDEEFNEIHQNLNFTGFDEQEEKAKPQDDRPKSKNQIYKEIIEKSKLHKHLRQELYEQNLNKAVQLDEEFPQFVSSLKFRNRDSNVKDKLRQNDHDFQKLANQLREDEKVVSNKVMEKNQKYTDKIRKKKTEQLNSLMVDSEDDGDIRGWVKNVNNEEEDQNDEFEEDQIDDVQLSSGEEGEQEQDGQDEEEQIEDPDAFEESEQESEQEEQESQEQVQSEKQVVPVPPPKNNKKKIIAKAAAENTKGKISRK